MRILSGASLQGRLWASPLRTAMARRWVFDVQTGERALSTTGGKTWGAAFRMAQYLEAAWGELRLARPRVLELGAGTGWLGMTLARNVAGRVCLTEQGSGGALEWLQFNVAANELLSSVECRVLDWQSWTTPEGDALAETVGDFDLVLGSDLVYDEAGARLLPRVLRCFLQRCRCSAFYAHTLHRYDHLDVDFFAALRAEGLVYRAVAAEGGFDGLDPVEASGFLEELFPEKRVAVYQVCLSGAEAALLTWSDVLTRSAGQTRSWFIDSAAWADPNTQSFQRQF